MRHAIVLFCVFATAFAAIGCASTAEMPQPPGEYLQGALNWIQTHAVASGQADWSAIRRDALALVPSPKTTGDTYPAIRLALSRIGDGNAFLLPPAQSHFDSGIKADYPEGFVRWVKPGSAAEKAGLRVGDMIETINGTAPRPLDGNPASFFLDFGERSELELTVRREGEQKPLDITFKQDPANFAFEGKPVLRRMGSGALEVGYVELVEDSGGVAGPYAGAVHQFIREVEESPACGWILDLRRNSGGNLWTYLAAVAPLLGEGHLGGFVYPDGRREAWTYEDEKIKWNDVVREESAVNGGVYRAKRLNPFVVLLVDRYTIAAGELVAVAFHGRPNVRIIGAPTGGVATLTDHTPLSDGAHLFVSGAYGFNSEGQVFDTPIQPDQLIGTDWRTLGTVEDDALTEAYVWLAGQPACS